MRRPAIVDEFTAGATHVPGLTAVRLAERISFDIYAVMPLGIRGGRASAVFIDDLTRRLGIEGG